MKIIYKDQSLLLTGDAEIEVEEALVEAHDRGDIDLRADVLKSGHHGSRTASSWEFLERVQPTTAVIQSGVDNSFGHPHEETLTSYFRMGLTVHRNDLSGRIQLTF